MSDLVSETNFENIIGLSFW